MQTRQKTKAEEVHYNACHFDVKLNKGEISEDIKSLANITKGNKEVNVKRSFLRNAKVKEEKSYNGRMTRGKKQLIEMSLLPTKKRLKSETDNLAIEGFCNFCKELWIECWFS